MHNQHYKDHIHCVIRYNDSGYELFEWINWNLVWTWVRSVLRYLQDNFYNTFILDASEKIQLKKHATVFQVGIKVYLEEESIK